MTEMFVSLGNWNWLILGFILMALEVLAPGIFLFWLGLAALLVGLISFALAVSWQIQLVMFAVFAAAAVPVWRRLARPKPDANASPFLNKRTDWRHDLNLGVAYKPAKEWTVTGQFSYLHNDSNIALNEFNRKQALITLRRDFF